MIEETPHKMPRLTQATFWGKSIDEKKAVFDTLHPTQHSQFFNTVNTAIKKQKDPQVAAEMSSHIAALRDHQQKHQGPASLALLIAGAAQKAGDNSPTTGLAGAVASGQTVALHHWDANHSNYTFHAVGPNDLHSYLGSLDPSIQKVRVTHRRVGAGEVHETSVSRNQMGIWSESEHKVHTENLTTAAPYLAAPVTEQRNVEKAGSRSWSELRKAVSGFTEEPVLPRAMAQRLVEPRGTVPRGESVGEDVHNMLLEEDPEYHEAWFNKAEKFGAQEEAVERAATRLAGTLENAEGGKRKRQEARAGAGNVNLPAIEEGLTIQGGGAKAAGGYSAQVPLKQQGEVWARPMDKTDAAIHDTVHLARAVMHNDPVRLFRATPDLPEFNEKEVPEVGTPGFATADARNVATMNLGVRDAKFSSHVTGMLKDIQGDSDHPADINGFPVHHYVSKVAAQAGVDTDEGRLQDIIDNAHALQSQRSQGGSQVKGLGGETLEAPEHVRWFKGGEPIVRTHAARGTPVGTMGERIYREGLHRTSEAVLSEYSRHLTNSNFSVVPSSGEAAIERARAAAADRNGLPMMVDAPGTVETPKEPKPKKEKAPRVKGKKPKKTPTPRMGGGGPTPGETRRRKQSEGIKGATITTPRRSAELEDWADKFLETPEEHKTAAMAHPAWGALAQYPGKEE